MLYTTVEVKDSFGFTVRGTCTKTDFMGRPQEVKDIFGNTYEKHHIFNHFDKKN